MPSNNEITMYSRPDQNQCIFTGRMMSDVIYEMRKTKGGKGLVPFVCFRAINNSNPYNYKQSTMVDFCAWGRMADEIHDTCKKGTDFWCISRMVNIYEMIYEVDGKKVLGKRALFDIKEFGRRRSSSPIEMEIDAEAELEEDPRTQDQIQRLSDWPFDQT